MRKGTIFYEVVEENWRMNSKEEGGRRFEVGREDGRSKIGRRRREDSGKWSSKDEEDGGRGWQ